MHYKKLEAKRLLVLTHYPTHPFADGQKSKDRKIQAMFLPKNTTAMIQLMDQDII
jgi:hypothetical protein